MGRPGRPVYLKEEKYLQLKMFKVKLGDLYEGYCPIKSSSFSIQMLKGRFVTFRTCQGCTSSVLLVDGHQLCASKLEIHM